MNVGVVLSGVSLRIKPEEEESNRQDEYCECKESEVRMSEVDDNKWRDDHTQNTYNFRDLKIKGEREGRKTGKGFVCWLGSVNVLSMEWL